MTIFSASKGQYKILVSRIKSLISPVKFISIINIAITGIGAVVGILNARLLGPESLGVIAVVLGVYSTIAAFIDVRLIDVVAKLYYQSSDIQYRGNVIRVYLILSGILGILIGVLSFLVVSRVAGYFTDVYIKPGWLAFSSFYYGLNYWRSAVEYQQRFSERFYLIGVWRFFGYMMWVATFLLILIKQPNLDGYFTASFWSAFLSTLLALGLSIFIWQRHEKFNILSFDFGRMFHGYYGELRLVFWGNLLGYAKLLHRGSDILLVGYFADDRVTGLYKIARSVADSTFVFYDSMNQVYFPRFMQLLSKNSFQEYRELVLKVISGAGLLTAIVLLFEWVGLSYFVQYVLTTKFVGAELAIIILTSTLFFIMGFQIWLWPIFVHSGRLRYFTGHNLAAGVLQYLIIILAFSFWIPDPALAALGYLSYYLFLIPMMWYLARALKPEIFHGLLNRFAYDKQVIK